MCPWAGVRKLLLTSEYARAHGHCILGAHHHVAHIQLLSHFNLCGVLVAVGTWQIGTQLYHISLVCCQMHDSFLAYLHTLQSVFSLPVATMSAPRPLLSITDTRMMLVPSLVLPTALFRTFGHGLEVVDFRELLRTWFDTGWIQGDGCACRHILVNGG